MEARRTSPRSSTIRRTSSHCASLWARIPYLGISTTHATLITNSTTALSACTSTFRSFPEYTTSSPTVIAKSTSISPTATSIFGLCRRHTRNASHIPTRCRPSSARQSTMTAAKTQFFSQRSRMVAESRQSISTAHKPMVRMEKKLLMSMTVVTRVRSSSAKSFTSVNVFDSTSSYKATVRNVPASSSPMNALAWLLAGSATATA
mmetsp:Transcript_57260/g.153014  ORF Transcript_57260/g.153014 Transcript_57260/m.153014 type:complete len:205 (-) Transcript_57260:527-1141(-)